METIYDMTARDLDPYPHESVTEAARDVAGLMARVVQTIGINPEIQIEEVRRLAIEYKRQQGVCDILQHQRKRVISEEKETERARLKREGEKFTEARLDDLARASIRYEKFLKVWAEEIGALGEVEAEYYAARNRWELAIELMRTARQELRSIE